VALKLRRRGDNEPVQGGDELTVVPSMGNRLAEMLVQQQVVRREQVDQAHATQEKTGAWLGEILVAAGAIDEEKLASTAATAAGLPLRELSSVTPDAASIARIPEAMARALVLSPISFVDNVLTVSVADPLDEVVIGQLLATAGPGVELRVCVSSISEVRALVNHAYRVSDAIGRHVQAFEQEQTPAINLTSTVDTTITADAPVVQVVNLIVAQALRDRASDVHIEPQEQRVRIRFRIDGALHEVMSLPTTMGPAIVSRIKILAEMNIVETRRPQDGQFEQTIDNRTIDVRVSTAPTIWGEKAVLRLLDRSRSLFTLRQLGMFPATHHAYSTIVHSPYGMVVCSGPTGSGKTTT